jgi:hypothetical protein
MLVKAECFSKVSFCVPLEGGACSSWIKHGLSHSLRQRLPFDTASSTKVSTHHSTARRDIHSSIILMKAGSSPKFFFPWCSLLWVFSALLVLSGAFFFFLGCRRALCCLALFCVGLFSVKTFFPSEVTPEFAPKYFLSKASLDTPNCIVVTVHLIEQQTLRELPRGRQNNTFYRGKRCRVYPALEEIF